MPATPTSATHTNVGHSLGGAIFDRRSAWWLTQNGLGFLTVRFSVLSATRPIEFAAPAIPTACNPAAVQVQQ